LLVLVLLQVHWTRAANSILDQIFQSLSKKLKSDEEEEDGSESPPDGTTSSSFAARPVHPSASLVSHGGIGSGLTVQHQKRLALYQTSLEQHYSQLWHHYRDHNHDKASAAVSENQTAHFQKHVAETYEMFLYGYDMEPPLWLLLSEEEQQEQPPLNGVATSSAATNAQTGETTQATNKPQPQESDDPPQSPNDSDSSQTKTTTNTDKTAYMKALQSYYQVMTQRHTPAGAAFPPFPPSKTQANLQLLQNMFQRGYDAYMYHGWPWGEVAPLSCRPKEFSLVPIPGLTVMDSLDTLLLLGNTTEFARAVERLRQLAKAPMAWPDQPLMDLLSLQQHPHESGTLFDLDQNVSVFETNIRVLGGLLSAHQMAEAWLPQVVIWKHDVFSVGNEPGEETIKTGRDPPDLDTATCHPMAEEGEGDDGTYPASSAPIMCTSTTTPSSLDDQQQQHHWSSSTTLRRRTTSSLQVWKNATQAKTKLAPDMLWSYDGILLDMALDIGKRLLPAFSTTTGIPYGTVHLQNGIPPGETTVASLAGGGTLVLEFELLSQLTHQPVFGKVAKRAMRSLWLRQTVLYLVGKHIDIQSGTWTETLSGIGSNSDSFYEYLAKQFFCFYQDADFWILFVAVYAGIFTELRRGDWYVDADMQAGARVAGRRVLESLMAFYPGLQVLVGEYAPAARSLNAFFTAREYVGFLPERLQFEAWKVDNGAGAGKHPLRPELLESSYLLHQAFVGTQLPSSSMPHHASSGWLWASDFALEKLAALTPAACGYASISDVRPHTTGGVHDAPDPDDPKQQQQHKRVKRYDEMPSFFLTETIKYLYLTFDGDNILHQDAIHRNWVFTTEAHPIHMPLELDHVDEGLDYLEQMLAHRVLNGHLDGSDIGSDIEKGRTEIWQNRQQIKEYVTLSNHHAEKQEEALNENIMLHNHRTGGESFFQYARVLQQAYVGSQNDAHDVFSPHGLGSGWNLRKACPNIYSSDMLFVHAMQGGSLDYVPKFTTVLNDNVYDHDDFITIPSSLESLAWWGSHLYPKSRRHQWADYQSQGKCPFPSNAPEQPVSNAETALAKQMKQPAPPIDQGYTEISTEMGSFQVTAFEGGTGFGVEQVETGHVLTATFVQDRQDVSISFVMVHAIYPFPTTDPVVPPPSVFVNGEWKVVPDFPTPNSERAVIIADLEGNSFSCDVELVQKLTETNEELAIIAQVPCTTGLFGPTHVAHLIKEGNEEGYFVEGTLFDPQSDDMFGCSATPDAETEASSESGSESNAEGDSCRNRIIQLVHRGECSFIEKSVNQRNAQNAEGVIVINSADQDVFIMSYGSEDGEFLTQKLPASVLITGADGNDLIEMTSLLANVIGDDTYIAARIAIRRQSSAEDVQKEEEATKHRDPTNDDGETAEDANVPADEASLTDNENLRFPIIRASPALLRVFSIGGWGIQAVQQLEQGHTNWHLQLMRHTFDKQETIEDQENNAIAPDDLADLEGDSESPESESPRQKEAEDF